MDIDADIEHSDTGYDVTCYFWLAVIEVLKTAENAAADGLRLNFIAWRFSQPNQLMGFLS